MQIKEAEIFSFGKFRDRNISFKPGINVIYGANEAGKSTLHAFLLAMLFGMDKGRGRASQMEGYLRYEPWHAPSYYSGALRFEVDGRPFYLERNFYHREKRDFLRNEADGEELSVAYGDLSMLLGGIHKETFGNTYDIPQSGAVTGKELADSLAEYLADAAESGDAGIHVTRAVHSLREKKRKLGTELKAVQSEKEQQAVALRIEQELLQRDCAKLREDIAAAKGRIDEGQMRLEQTASLVPIKTVQRCEEDRSVRKSRHKAGIFLALSVLFVGGIAWVWLGARRAFFDKEVIWGITLGLCLAAIAAAVSGILIFRKANRQTFVAADKSKTAFLDADSENAKDVQQLLSLLSESLTEKETRLYNVTEELGQLAMQTERERKLYQELEAVQIAIDEIERLRKELCEEAADTLNSEVSHYVSMITAGRYDSVRIDDNGKLWVAISGKEMPPDALSRGTLEQFYLALRLAVGKTVTREEPMPIFLDDAFVLYDDDRLRQTLKVLSDMNEQILLFTCQKREGELLASMGIDYHEINL